MFFLTPKRSPNHKKRAHLGSPFCARNLPNSQRVHSDPKKWVPKGPIPSFGGGPVGQSWLATLCKARPTHNGGNSHLKPSLPTTSPQPCKIPYRHVNRMPFRQTSCEPYNGIQCRSSLFVNIYQSTGNGKKKTMKLTDNKVPAMTSL